MPLSATNGEKVEHKIPPQTPPTELVLRQGKIYFLDYGGNTQVIGRYIESDTTNHYFYDLLHYWNGYQTFRRGPREYCVKHGIADIRPASKAEKHTLIQHEIQHDCI